MSYNGAEVSAMSYIGTVRNGRIELPPDAQLPDGTVVRVERVANDEPDPADCLARFAVDGGPADLAGTRQCARGPR